MPPDGPAERRHQLVRVADGRSQAGKGDHGLMLKGPMLYEAAVRVPLIMSWSGQLPRGERRSDLVEWFTLGSTFLEAAGLPPLARSQAPSILPLARESAGAGRPWALCEYRDSGHPYDSPVHLTMLRVGRFKLIAQHGSPASDRSRTGELYDLESDPNELVNLWDDPGHISTRLELQEQLLDILVASEDRNQPREADW
jgi:arylsulfatase